MFKPLKKDKFRLKGIFTSIPYEDRLQNEKWSDYFGKYEPQKYGLWDSDSCWCISAINCIEDQLEFLWKKGQFSAEAKDFFTVNGYIDADGDFSISERFIEILSGNRDTGGTQSEAWELVEKYGCIPRSQLTYSVEQSNRWPTQESFDNDYFYSDMVTQKMKDLGQQFLKYVNIVYKKIGQTWFTPDFTELRTALLQAPIQIGIPIPVGAYGYNQPKVDWDGSHQLAHAVELYAVNDPSDPHYDPSNKEYPYFIYDQYQPERKQLSADYYIGSCTQGIVTVKALPNIVVPPIPVPLTFWQKFWTSMSQYFESQRTFGVARSPEWTRFKKQFSNVSPKKCVICGNEKVQLHHKKPFAENNDLELDINNVCWLCEGLGTFNHHLGVGHLGDFHSINEQVDKDIEYLHTKILNRPHFNSETKKWIYNFFQDTAAE